MRRIVSIFDGSSTGWPALVGAVLLGLSSLGLAACQDEGPFQEAAEEIEDEAQDARDEVEDEIDDRS